MRCVICHFVPITYLMKNDTQYANSNWQYCPDTNSICILLFYCISFINMCKTIKKTGYKKGHIQLLHIHLWQEDNITYLWSTSNNLWNYQNKNKHVINQHTNVFANRRQSEQNGNNECNVPCKGMKEYKHLTVWKEKKPAN